MASSPLASHLISLIIATPLFAVWIVGIVLALARWRKHPSVSALLAGGLMSVVVLMVGRRLGIAIILNSLPPGQNASVIALDLGILGIASSLLGAGAWTAVLVAVFGWRPLPGATMSGPPWQFGILALLVVTLAVAVLFGLARWLVLWLGESAAHLIQLVDDIPLFVCWLVALAVAIRRWKWHPRVSLLAVSGIGIHIVNTIVSQMVWIIVSSGGGSVNWILALNVLGLLAAATGWAIVIAAVLRDREEIHQRSY
jgi:hypothetical protein